MKKIYTALVAVFAIARFSYAQTTWTPSGNNIYNPNSGNVGIGTTSPSALLDVESSTAPVTSLVKTGSINGFAQLQAQNDNGANSAFHHAVFGSSYPGTLFGAPLANSAVLYADGTTVSGMLIGTKTATPVTICTNNTSAITILPDGKIGIGTTTPHEELSVNGNIRSKQVKVEINNWPDYVFKPNYNIPSLTAVKIYIDKYHHLPDMPSAAEVAKDGLDLGETNRLLLKKVEELTLYLLEKDKQATDQQKLLTEQQQINQSLQQQINQLAKKIKN
ncbi:hypothetical protein [Mucilaginibacter sp. UR6-11]|uniref:hypothetical protein n=1 Tax=Mucilaginibacter sp. UR6-11 TaxID=1435644 RepID=UPI001E5E54F5|nr:hypothetical protein [Mucilaginibacter sp. UR6-11]MCC8427254.1 hypothetical protein [Mucilaginibacter sp. UR6-11]